MAYITRTKDDPGDVGRAADQQQSIDNEEALLVLITEAGVSWIADTDTWTYVSATTFTVVGDETAIFVKGTRIKLTQTTVKYFVVIGSSFGGGVTTVTVTAGSDYSLADAAITDTFYSYAVCPPGYPTWFDYTPVFAGFAADPANPLSRFCVEGTKCTFAHAHDPGTSNDVTFTITLPITAAMVANANWNGALGVTYNANNYLGAGEWSILSAATVVVLYTAGHGAWNAANNKAAYFIGTYEI